ncbi:hypothetical protein LXA43DRAFT_78368 [Ganoderma leucocontextum]|nr:hypothetical protein LXA43DRAFT_78368 [Ganoderma leucocontextum]
MCRQDTSGILDFPRRNGRQDVSLATRTQHCATYGLVRASSTLRPITCCDRQEAVESWRTTYCISSEGRLHGPPGTEKTSTERPPFDSGSNGRRNLCAACQKEFAHSTDPILKGGLAAAMMRQRRHNRSCMNDTSQPLLILCISNPVSNLAPLDSLLAGAATCGDREHYRCSHKGCCPKQASSPRAAGLRLPRVSDSGDHFSD